MNQPNKMKRSHEEVILMTLSFGGSISILPFAVMRLISADWNIAIVDAMMVMGMFALGTHVYLSKETKFASMALTILALTGMSAAIHLKGINLVFWAYPTMIGVYFILDPKRAAILTLLASITIAPALINQMETITYIAVIMTLIVNNLFVYVFASRMQRHRKMLSLLVRSDELTGAGNRRALNEKLAELVEINKRITQKVSLIMVDIDHFKSVNDNYGHATGDQVLIKMTELVTSRIRTVDGFYRFGGEEFVVVAMGADQESAREIAENLRNMIEESDFITDRKITVSLGVAELSEKERVDDWLGRGDKALYQAKETGRNKTCVADK